MSITLTLDFHDECREKAIYIPGTLKVHFVERIISKLHCKFTFFIIYQSKVALKEIEYAISCVPFILEEGNYYLVNSEGELWSGQLIKLMKSGATVRCLQKAAVLGSMWRWPEKPNEEEYILEGIISEIETSLNCSSSSLRSNPFAHVPEQID